MPRRIPLAFALQAWDHVRKTGHPLLRKRLPEDVLTIAAYAEQDEEGYTIEFEEYSDDVSGITTFRALAAFVGMSPMALKATWRKRGLPKNWLPEDIDEEFTDPYCFLDELQDLLPMTRIAEVLGRLPETFDLSTGDRKKVASMGEVGLPEPLGGSFCDTPRPGDSTKIFSVDSPLALSCLQYLLDATDSHARVVVKG